MVVTSCPATGSGHLGGSGTLLQHRGQVVSARQTVIGGGVPRTR